MAANKQLLLILLSILLILTSSTCRTLRFKDFSFTKSISTSNVHNEDAKEKPMTGIKAFAASIVYLKKNALVPPSEPSHRRNWKMAGATMSEDDAALAKAAGGV